MNMAELLGAKLLFKKAISEKKTNILTPPRSTWARLTKWGQSISGISFYISFTHRRPLSLTKSPNLISRLHKNFSTHCTLLSACIWVQGNITTGLR